MAVLIAGGGISGLVLALSCHQVGIPFKVFEAATELRPLGLGINLQPQAVRELIDLELGNKLDKVGIRTRDYGMYTRKGLHIWTEPRGVEAGYKWPAYSVHRGLFHMMLYDAVIERAGVGSVETGWKVTGFDSKEDSAALHMENDSGEKRTEVGAMAVGADGIHSAIRKQMYPDEGEPNWGGLVLWRGLTKAPPFLTSASMVLIGRLGLGFVSYPVSQPDPETGESLINWIANLEKDPGDGWTGGDYNRGARLEDFLPKFEDFVFDWLDVPGLIKNADCIFEYPMVDRDPVQRWTYGLVTLMGDAAHAAYPVGSNGAGAGIIDARKIVASVLKNGQTEAALQAYEDDMRPKTEKMVLTNRVAGPDKILDIVDERCGGQFEDIHDVITHEEMEEHAANYKRIAGYGIKETNEQQRTIPEGASYAEPAVG